MLAKIALYLLDGYFHGVYGYRRLTYIRLENVKEQLIYLLVVKRTKEGVSSVTDNTSSRNPSYQLVWSAQPKLDNLLQITPSWPSWKRFRPSPYAWGSSSSPPLNQRHIACTQNAVSMVPNIPIITYTTVLTLRVMPRSLKLIFGTSGFLWGLSPLLLIFSRDRGWWVEKEERMRLLASCDERGWAGIEFSGVWGLLETPRNNAERRLGIMFLLYLIFVNLSSKRCSI